MPLKLLFFPLSNWRRRRRWYEKLDICRFFATSPGPCRHCTCGLWQRWNESSMIELTTKKSCKQKMRKVFENLRLNHSLPKPLRRPEWAAQLGTPHQLNQRCCHEPKDSLLTHFAKRKGLGISLHFRPTLLFGWGDSTSIWSSKKAPIKAKIGHYIFAI